MNNAGVKIEIHLIQNFAPSNLNRDDTGQPKSATFGGFRRARVSSQCAKRAVRQWWREHNLVSVGERTKLLKSELAPELRIPGRTEEEIRKALDTFLTQFYSKMDGDKTKVLIFVSRDERSTCVQAINENWETLSNGRKVESKPSAISEALRRAKTSADIALFGRMLAEQPGSNTDAACQVAHPISTHRVDMEMDFYTAVDDLNPAEETGAGMMGIVGFNSACYYRYAVVDRDQLARNMSRKTKRENGKWKEDLNKEDYQEADTIIKAFLEAMIYATPSGKQNSFAAQNLPSFGLFVRRQNGVPISLANAFAKPIRPTKDSDDLVALSVDALTKHWDSLEKVFGGQGVEKTACFHVGQEDRLNGLSESDRKGVKQAIDAIMEAEQ